MRKSKKQHQNIIKQLAQQHGVAVDEVTRDIQAAIDDAWNNPDPAIRERQRKLFPKGKPTVSEFIRVMTAYSQP